MKEYNVFDCHFQAVDRLKAGALAVEAVTAALVELEVGWLWSIFDNLKSTFINSPYMDNVDEHYSPYWS